MGTEVGILRGLPGIIDASNRMVHIPTLPSIPVTAPNVGTNRAGGGTVVHHYESHVNVPVAGNVTAEDDLTRTILTAVDTGVAEGIRQRQRAMGAT